MLRGIRRIAAPPAEAPVFEGFQASGRITNSVRTELRSADHDNTPLVGCSGRLACAVTRSARSELHETLRSAFHLAESADPSTTNLWNHESAEHTSFGSEPLHVGPMRIFEPVSCADIKEVIVGLLVVSTCLGAPPLNDLSDVHFVPDSVGR